MLTYTCLYRNTDCDCRRRCRFSFSLQVEIKNAGQQPAGSTPRNRAPANPGALIATSAPPPLTPVAKSSTTSGSAGTSPLVSHQPPSLPPLLQLRYPLLHRETHFCLCPVPTRTFGNLQCRSCTHRPHYCSTQQQQQQQQYNSGLCVRSVSVYGQ